MKKSWCSGKMSQENQGFFFFVEHEKVFWFMWVKKVYITHILGGTERKIEVVLHAKMLLKKLMTKIKKDKEKK